MLTRRGPVGAAPRLGTWPAALAATLSGVLYAAGQPGWDIWPLGFVCGVPLLYDNMCGPRTEKALREGSVLATLGYTEDMVAKM